MELDEKWIWEVVEGNTDSIFQDVAEHFDLKYGDISPCQAMRLSRVVMDFTEILVEYKNQNK
jgi:hypothetical protein